MKKITVQELQDMSKAFAEELVKAVVDLDRKLMAIGGGMHADEEEVLLEQGSEQQNLWGINIYPHLPRDRWIEFDSMINIRPSQGNRSRGIENQKTQELIKKIVHDLIQ